MREFSDCQTKSLGTFKGVVLPFFFGIVSGYFVSFIAILIVSFLFSLAGSISLFILNAVSLILICVCSFVAGFVTVMHFKHKGLLIGGLSGFLVFLVSFFICCVFFGGVVSFSLLPRLICTVLFGAFGGVLSVNRL